MEARILLRRWSGRHASVPGCQEQDDAYARCDTAEGDVLLQFLVWSGSSLAISRARKAARLDPIDALRHE
jgi:hypothetical protein